MKKYRRYTTRSHKRSLRGLSLTVIEGEIVAKARGVAAKKVVGNWKVH